MRNIFILLLMLTTLAGLGCSSQKEISEQQPVAQPNWTYQPGPVAKLPVMDFQKTILAGDHIVFLGDDMTQQMFYTRDIATALLSLRPNDNLRIFNAGKAEATAHSAAAWAGDVLKLTKANVVFVNFGLNDVFLKVDKEDANATNAIDAYKKNLAQLVDVIRETKSVRQIILVGPPAVQSGLTPELAKDSYNAQLIYLGEKAEAVAKEKGTGYIDLFTHTSAVYLGQMQVGGDPLTLGGKLPSEEGHVVIASVILRGIGITGKELDGVGFCPLLPGRMGRIRPALAVETTIPNLNAASASRGIYLTLTRYDEAFFKQWRLAGRNRLSWTPEEAAAQVELTWGNVLQQAQELQLVLQGPATSE